MAPPWRGRPVWSNTRPGRPSRFKRGDARPGPPLGLRDFPLGLWSVRWASRWLVSCSHFFMVTERSVLRGPDGRESIRAVAPIRRFRSLQPGSGTQSHCSVSSGTWHDGYGGFRFCVQCSPGDHIGQYVFREANPSGHPGGSDRRGLGLSDLVKVRRPQWLLAVVAVASAAPACSSASGASAALGRADLICSSFLPGSVPTTLGSPLGAELMSVNWTTAGQITTLAIRTLGHPLHPWDGLPGDHFVAQCGYPDTTRTTSPSTTTCPGGLPNSVEASQQFYVDEQDRWTAAIPSTSTPPVLPGCVYPLVAPTSRPGNP